MTSSQINKLVSDGECLRFYRMQSWHKITLVVVACLALFMIENTAYAASHAQDKQVLMLDMTPAMCLFYPSRARMNQCLEGYRVTVAGLNMGYNCTSTSIPNLPPVQQKIVRRVMPDQTFVNQTWRRYGACSPLSANHYFRQITFYANQLKLPAEMTSGKNRRISKSAFYNKLGQLNAGFHPSSVRLICKNSNQHQSILLKMHVCYQGTQFSECPTQIDNCREQLVILGTKK